MTKNTKHIITSEKTAQIVKKDPLRFARHARSSATKRAYKSDWNAWVDWTIDQGVCELPGEPTDISSWISDCIDIGMSVATVERYLVSVSQAHKLAGFPSPVTPIVKETLKGIKRIKGSAQHRAEPITIEHLKRIAETLPDTLQGKLYLAMILIGWSGGLRRSELVALDLEDIEEKPEGFRVTIRSSKTDQEGLGHVIGIPFAKDCSICPVLALGVWTEAARIEKGAVFLRATKTGKIGARLSGRAVSRIIKLVMKKSGYDSRKYSGHSLRAGFATAAAAAGKSELEIMRHTGHKSIKIFRRYVREGELFTRNPLTGLI